MQKSAKIRLSKAIFYVGKRPSLSKKIIEEYKFMTTGFMRDIFLITSIFKSLYFLKMSTRQKFSWTDIKKYFAGVI